MFYSWVSFSPPFHVLIVDSLPPSHSFLSCCCLGSNSLFGTIPTELGDLSALNELGLGEFLSSFPRAYSLLSLPPSHSFLSCCCLDSNSLTGTIPTELGDLLALNFLNLGEFLSSYPSAYSLLSRSFSLFPIVLLSSHQRSRWYRANRTWGSDKTLHIVTR
jgi:hypothetical protein